MLIFDSLVSIMAENKKEKLAILPESLGKISKVIYVETIDSLVVSTVFSNHFYLSLAVADPEFQQIGHKLIR